MLADIKIKNGTSHIQQATFNPPERLKLSYMEEQFTAVFALGGDSHAEPANMIHWHIIWRNNRTYDEQLRRIVAEKT